MLLFLVPGLVPTKRELEMRKDAHAGMSAQNYSSDSAMAMNHLNAAPQYYAPRV